ncbi:MAG: hypothetical protein PHU85_01930 [Phycisphaerae bacterium]|nr:hypothetical protein [Phycisphaerae bacterium]
MAKTSDTDPTYTGEHLPGQTTFLDLHESDETAPVFTKHHDISAFTSDESARHALTCVSYSADRKRLAATNGHTLITVPVEQDGIPDMLIDGELLHKAIADAGEFGVQCEVNDGRVLLYVPDTVTRLAVNAEGTFPDVYAMPALRKRWKPDAVVTFSPKQLDLVIKYAKRIKASGISLAFNIDEACSKPRLVEDGVRFTFDGVDGIAADVVGVIMPMTPGEEREPRGISDTAKEAIDRLVDVDQKVGGITLSTATESVTIPPEPCGESAVSDDLEAEIIRRHNCGEGQQKIADALKITRKAVRKALGVA